MLKNLQNKYVTLKKCITFRNLNRKIGIHKFSENEIITRQNVSFSYEHINNKLTT